MKLQADTVNGIFEVSSFDDFDGCEILSEQDFYEELGSLSEDKVIGAELSEEMAARIGEEYGIKK